MNKAELLQRHGNQKGLISDDESDRTDSISSANQTLESFLVDHFQDAKDDSSGRGFTVAHLQSLPPEAQREFEWLVNDVIGLSLWWSYLWGSISSLNHQV